MNRIGLIIALAVGTVTGLLFGIVPQLDIEVSRLFYGVDEFILGRSVWLVRARDISMWIVAALAAPAVIAPIVKLLVPGTRMLVAGRTIIFLLSTLALAPGLVTNVILKDHWGRARPIDVREFGHEDRFTPWWDPRGDCPNNCSFVAGEPSGAFWTLAPASLAPPSVRAVAYGAAIAFGAAIGTLRIAFGGHFFTDVVFSGVLTFLIIWIVHGLLYRLPATRIADEAIERRIERVGLAIQTAWGAALARLASAARRGGSRAPGGP